MDNAATGRIAAIGTWDGVHPGHRFVLSSLADAGHRMNLEPVAVTFSTHPLSVVAPERAPKNLSSLPDRIAMLRDAGAKDVIVLDFDNSLRAMTAAEFLRMLRDRYNIHAVMLGFNNSFGSDRLKGVDAYRAVAPEGMKILQMPEYEGNSGKVSSSLIRRLISAGDVAEAACRLGRLYCVKGRVVGGRRLGRTIGFPTANLAVDPRRLLPAAGVYAADAQQLLHGEPDRYTFQWTEIPRRGEYRLPAHRGPLPASAHDSRSPSARIFGRLVFLNTHSRIYRTPATRGTVPLSRRP